MISNVDNLYHIAVWRRIHLACKIIPSQAKARDWAEDTRLHVERLNGNNRGGGQQLTGSEIATVRQGTALVVSVAQGIVEAYREKRTVSNHKIQLLRVYSEKTIALARISAVQEISDASLRVIIDISQTIESLPSGSIALPFAMDRLDHANRKLRSILDGF